MASTAQGSIVGNLGGDPETRYTNSGQMNVSFSVATNRKRGDRETVTWWRVTAWGKLAEALDKLAQDGALVKGRQVFVQGEVYQEAFTGRDGGERTSLECSANVVQLLGTPDGDRQQSQGRGSSSMPREREPVAVGSDDVDDLPF